MPRMTTSWALVVATALAACATTSGRDTSTSDRRDTRSPVATAHPFEVEGRVGEVSKGVLGRDVLGLGGSTLVVSRDDAPAAPLRVTEDTRITLDDKPAKLTDLRQGDEVRAKFDFDGSTPVAIEIDASAKR